MSKRNDITTPEGYFENLQLRLSDIPARKQESETSFRGIRRLAPYAAIAASFLLVVMLGNFILGRSTAPAQEDDGWTYVSYLANALDPDGAPLMEDAWWDGEEEAYEGLSPEDIVNYLLADGISVEQLAYLSYEEGF